MSRLVLLGNRTAWEIFNKKCLPQDIGAIDRTMKMRNVEHPNIRSAMGGLKSKLSVTYCYFILETGLMPHLLNVGDSGTGVADAPPPFIC